MKFKVGQRVVAVKDGNAIMGGAFDYKAGDKGIVTDITRANTTVAMDNGGTYCGVNPWNFEEAKETMEFKVGDKVEVIDASGSGNAKLGDRCEIIGFSGICLDVRTTDGREYSMYPRRFKLIKEEQSIPKFTVGSKVIVADGSYSMEFVDGKAVVKYENINSNSSGNRFVYEVTAVDLVLPADNGPFYESKEVNDTIIRRISDGRVFFVQQQFLKEYIVEPKFKRGDWVIYGTGYYRVSFSTVKDGNVIYRITQRLYDFNGVIGSQVSEGELQEAK